MLTNSIFTYNLNQKILPGLVTLGKYSKDCVSLTVTTPSNKIIMYDISKLSNVQDSDKSVRALNISQPITNITAVTFKEDECDTLLICTKTSIYVYDVDKNVDIFTCEILDGANTVTYGSIGGNEDVIFVGGNCSVQGYDKLGGDVYWIVTGDNVRSLALVDIDNDEENELVVGSDDYDIRVFKRDDLVFEITETQTVTHLYSLDLKQKHSITIYDIVILGEGPRCLHRLATMSVKKWSIYSQSELFKWTQIAKLIVLGNGLFAYALANGTVGVYEKMNRIWRVKSKNRATYLTSYDINGDGIIELITGWQGGKVDGRDVRTGEVLFKDNFDQTIAGICEGDCRDSGKNDLMVISITGEIRCYNPRASRPLKAKNMEDSYEEETIRELLTRKQGLMLELKKYEYSGRYTGIETDDNRDGAIPAKTRLQTSLGISLGSTNQAPHVEVNLSTNNDTIIRAVIIFAEGIFKDETHVKHPESNNATNKMTISLYPPRDVPIDIHIKAFIGYRESKQFHVFELTRQLPRFAMYTLVDKPPTDTISNVVFFVNERIQRIILWINRNFLLNKAIDSSTHSELALYFHSLRDGKELAFLMDPSGKITIQTDNIVLAGDLIQSLVTYLNLEQLKSVAHFPKEEENCVGLLEKLQELEMVKRRLNVDLSNKSSLIRNLIVRGEDARILNDLKLMKKFYSELNELNNDLRSGYEIRVTNYDDIVSTIKELNGIIQRASRLRFGKSKTDPVSLAKTAISSNNSGALIKVIRSGEI